MTSSFISLLILDLNFEMIGMYLSVFLIASIKFAVAALIAMGNPHFSFWEIILTAGGGAIAGSVIFVYFGTQIKRWVKANFKRSTPTSFARRRQIYKIWKRYGLPGVAFLAPLISPMVSIGIAVSFGEKPRKILLAMCISIIGWSVILATFKEVILAIIR
ncbi:MAG: hypothetical protein SF052_09925 [Bacteroidia bacterium]|nr:hypothetical protein [Bacteroidia bacterium]